MTDATGFSSYPDTEELTAKAAVSYLIEHIEYHDSYGVEGSGFMACLLCRGGGAPGISLVHEETCPVKRCEKIAAEWVDELNADREDCCPPAQGRPDRHKLASMLKVNGFTSRDGTYLQGGTYGVIDAVLSALSLTDRGSAG